MAGYDDPYGRQGDPFGEDYTEYTPSEYSADQGAAGYGRGGFGDEAPFTTDTELGPELEDVLWKVSTACAAALPSTLPARALRAGSARQSPLPPSGLRGQPAPVPCGAWRVKCVVYAVPLTPRASVWARPVPPLFVRPLRSCPPDCALDGRSAGSS